MDVTSSNIFEVFSRGGDTHYVLPHFQRQYSWDRENWQTLLDDVFVLYKEYDPDKEPEHFFGSLVVIRDGNRNGQVPAYNLVDGQQRLTTISLLLCVLRDLILDEDPKLAKSVDKLIRNLDEEGDIRYKLLPTTKYGDRNAYISLLRGQTPPICESSIPEAYLYLRNKLEQKIENGSIQPDSLYNVISNCFRVVFINLDRNENPYQIFESLNAKGKALSPADLVRNYIAMKLPVQKQEIIFQTHWAKIENWLQENRKVGRIGELTAFLRHYLAMTSRTLSNENYIYARFRDRCEHEFKKDDEFIEEIKTLQSFAEYYDRLLRPDNEPDRIVREALHRLDVLELSTAYPFLLRAFYAYHSEDLSKDGFLDLLDVLENYLVRRHVCGEPTNFLNKMFPNLWRDIEDEMEDNVSFGDALRLVLADKRYPSNQKLQESIRSRKQYDSRSQRKLCFILENINRYMDRGRDGHTVLNGNPTIEHILPQSPVDEWKDDLGEGFDDTYREYIHTLGNLTLVTQDWNAQLSNGPFELKKRKLAQHALKINSGYFNKEIEVWNESSILLRAEQLSQSFIDLWPAFGEERVTAKEQYKQPQSVTILGENISVSGKTWRQFMKIVVEWIIQNRPEQFQEARKSLNVYFCDDLTEKKYPKDWHELSNGTYVYHSSSAKAHKSFCRRILENVGVSESDWTLEEEINP